MNGYMAAIQAQDDANFVKFLEGVVGVVVASNYERHMLWDENRRREQPYSWEENLSGLGEHMGNTASMPTYCSLWTSKIDGHKILFIEPTSMVVDHRLIEKWMEEKLPDTVRNSDGRINKTDPMNFHIVIHEAQRRAASQ